jgi:hypothetical protein
MCYPITCTSHLKRGCYLRSNCDTIFKPKNLWLQALLVTLDDKTLLWHIRENLINNSLVITIKNHRKSPPNDFNKFEFVIFYCIMVDCYTYQKALHGFKFSKLDKTHWLLAILDSTIAWS